MILNITSYRIEHCSLYPDYLNATSHSIDDEPQRRGHTFYKNIVLKIERARRMMMMLYTIYNIANIWIDLAV